MRRVYLQGRVLTLLKLVLLMIAYLSCVLLVMLSAALPAAAARAGPDAAPSRGIRTDLCDLRRGCRWTRPLRRALAGYVK